MTFPGFDHFYYVTASGGPEFRTKISLSIDEAWAVTRGEITPPAPVELRWSGGRRVPRDFVHTELVVPKIVHERIVDILVTRAFRGWSVFSVELYGPKGERIVGYHGLAIHGRCGPVQPERSEEFQKVGPVGNRFTAYRGLYFQESSWDGTDLFMPSNPFSGQVFVTASVRDELVKAKVKGAIFDRLDLNERGWR